MLDFVFDVIIFDNIGMPFTGSTPRLQALGGSELGVILVAESLARMNKKVLVLNNCKNPAFEYGVSYYPLSVLNYKKINCINLILNRTSELKNENLIFQNLFVYLQDIYTQEYINYFENIQRTYKDTVFITVSDWLLNNLPNTLNKKYIHNMIPDWVYNVEKKKNYNRYIYCSAAFKGLKETIDFWNIIKKQNKFKKIELVVCNPGYDIVDQILLKNNKINFLGTLKFSDMVYEMANCAGLFYVNTYPETFCNIAAIANALKIHTHILCLNDYGALRETLGKNNLVRKNIDDFLINFYQNLETETNIPQINYRQSYVFDKWKEVLKYA